MAFADDPLQLAAIFVVHVSAALRMADHLHRLVRPGRLSAFARRLRNGRVSHIDLHVLVELAVVLQSKTGHCLGAGDSTLIAPLGPGGGRILALRLGAAAGLDGYNLGWFLLGQLLRALS